MAAPSSTTLRSCCCANGEAEKPGTKANSAGNLAAYLIAKHGSGEDALTDEEIKNLNGGFDNGGGKTDAELAAAL
ncbi:hypothetical protein AB5N19_01765 [Seiridium cardinale]